ncbi:hypothetical protein DAI22_05g147501 [Oryza sativa Japonica Group]|nr:hypothetical protein DAI22_05g147501 [Oryza sativa Japonica Group]
MADHRCGDVASTSTTPHLTKKPSHIRPWLRPARADELLFSSHLHHAPTRTPSCRRVCPRLVPSPSRRAVPTKTIRPVNTSHPRALSSPFLRVPLPDQERITGSAPHSLLGSGSGRGGGRGGGSEDLGGGGGGGGGGGVGG